MRLFFLLMVIGFSVQAQTCRVLDPELQRSYSGGCANGLAEGEGAASGIAEYRGGFHQGKKHGKGVKTWANGDRYEGGFVEDRKEGFGIYTWGRGKWEGERYEGGYSNDQRHGFGNYSWPTGDYYAGPWQSDVGTGPPTGMMLAKKKFEEEARAAVAKEGVKVCREMAAGKWERGVVVSVTADQVGVRMDKTAETIWDYPTAWTPCL